MARETLTRVSSTLVPPAAAESASIETEMAPPLPPDEAPAMLTSVRDTSGRARPAPTTQSAAPPAALETFAIATDESVTSGAPDTKMAAPCAATLAKALPLGPGAVPACVAKLASVVRATLTCCTPPHTARKPAGPGPECVAVTPSTLTTGCDHALT